MSAPLPGWYDDPTHPGRLRWWDGSTWTSNTRELPVAAVGGVTSVDASHDPTPMAQDASAAQPTREPTPKPEPAAEAAPWPAQTAPSPATPTPVTANPASVGPALPPLPQPPVWDGAAVGQEHRGPMVPGVPPPPNLPATGAKRGRIVGLVALAVVGAGVAAGINVPDDGSVFALARGDCFNDDGGFEEGADPIASVPIVECTSPHDAEVYATFDLEGARHPGNDALGEESLAGCVDRFEDEVGLPLSLVNLDVTTLRPSMESWDQGDRGVVCILTSYTGEPLEGSALGRPVDWSMQVGDCFDAPLQGVEGVLAAGFERRPCDVDHAAQLYVRESLPAGPHPGGRALFATAEDICLDRFADHVGQPWEESELEFGTIIPSLGRWAADDREMACFVFDPAGLMIGEAANWAIAADPVGGGFGAYDVSRLGMGDCFDDPFEEGFDGPILPVSCNEPHHNEAFVVFELDGDRLPDDLEAVAVDRCDVPFSDYVGQERDRLVWFWLGPDPISWQQGDRTVVCALYAADFSNLTRSMRAGPV